MKHRSFHIVILAFLMALGTGSLGRAQEVFTAEHLASLRSVVSVHASPDGRHIAYVLAVPRDPFEEDDGPAWQELHVVDESGASRPYVTGATTVQSVAWTPDGESLSFLAEREGDEERSLYVIPLAGGEARKVLSHETAISDYAWAPDGRRVAFLAQEAEAEEQKKLREKGFSQIVFEENLRDVRVWVADVSQEEPKPVMLPLDDSASSLHWSPVGSTLVLALAPTSSVDDSYVGRRIRFVNAETGAVIGRAENPGKLGSLSWSPDGRHVAAIAAADAHDPLEGRLMLVSPESGELRDLLPDYDDGHVSSAGWLDEDTLLFVVDEGVWSFVAQVELDGTGFQRVIPTDGPVLAGLSISRGGRVAGFVGSTPAHPNEVYRWDAGATLAKRLTDNNPWLDNVKLAKQEVVRFAARDGIELEGMLIHPLGGPAVDAPLILTVHGGPESRYSNGWVTSYSNPGQVAAARGFAVFYPNYRGSTGRGRAFSTLSQGDAAGKEFDDLVDAVDHLVAQGLVDRDRVGITGGSYGGYASAWGATYYTDRFAAAVMFVGISELVTKEGTSDIPRELYLVHQKHWPWEAWDYYRERSPIYYVEKARTPILILHGDRDPRVHPSQSLALYRHLKSLGNTPVRLIWYPGEGHGNRRAASRFDYNLRMVRWMEHYLMGPGGDPPPPDLDYGRQEESKATETTP
jgi:dipeptidyl aminopeptidase/acylaminoacyl peptidase